MTNKDKALVADLASAANALENEGGYDADLVREAASTITRLLKDIEGYREALAKAFSAADDLLAPVCAEAGRMFWEAPEADMRPYMPELKAKLFAELYDATHPDILDALTQLPPPQEVREKFGEELDD